MIETSSISIIVQGAITPITPTVIKRLRSCFPGAEIIVSTWKNSDLCGIQVDKIVLSDDPGCVIADPVTNTMNNVKRQLVSTIAGLAHVTCPYTLKTRSDLIFEDAWFLRYFGKYDAIPSLYFQNRMLICDYYTRNPRVFETCFHPSDWILFGCTEDVYNYYAHTPLMSSEEGEWFRRHKKESDFFTNYLCRFTPEQYIFLSFLKQKESISCECYYDCTPASIKQTERAFSECFVVLDYQKQLNMVFPKYNPNRYMEKHTLFSHWQWKAVYQHYCLKQNSLLWCIYIIRAAGMTVGAKLRNILIRWMDQLGIKERVKDLLCRISAHKKTRY